MDRDERYFLSIWWPVVDVTFGHGAEFNTKSWNRGMRENRNDVLII